MSRRMTLAGLSLAALTTVTVGCPIQRPPVPMDYFPFRDALRDSVAAVAEVEMAGRPSLQGRLEESIAELAPLTRTDSLFQTLAADPLLSPLAVSLEDALQGVLRSDAASGRARKAFGRAEGQRLAVDAILIGLGTALRRLRVDREEGAGRSRPRPAGLGPRWPSRWPRR